MQKGWWFKILLLDLVAKKAQDAFNGVGNFFNQNVVKPAQQGIQDWGRANPRQTQQITQAPQNINRSFQDILSSFSRQPINPVIPFIGNSLPKLPTFGEVGTQLKTNISKPKSIIPRNTGKYTWEMNPQERAQVNEDMSIFAPMGGVANVGKKEAIKVGEGIFRDAAPVVKQTIAGISALVKQKDGKFIINKAKDGMRIGEGKTVEEAVSAAKNTLSGINKAVKSFELPKGAVLSTDKTFYSLNGTMHRIPNPVAPVVKTIETVVPTVEKAIANAVDTGIKEPTAAVIKKTQALFDNAKVGGVAGKAINAVKKEGKKTTDLFNKFKADKQAVEFLNPGNKATRAIREVFLDTETKFKQIFGKNYDTYVKPILDKHVERLGEGVRWRKTYESMLEKLPVKVGSSDDKLLHEFRFPGGKEKVISQVGKAKAKVLEQTYEQLKGTYSEILKFINKNRKAAKLDPIPEFKGDFLSQIGQGGNPLNNLESFISGEVQSNGPISGAIFKKQGGKPKIGAIQSMRDYLQLAMRAGHSDISAKEMNTLRTRLAEAGAPEEVLSQLTKFEDTVLGNRVMGGTEKALLWATGKVRSAAVVGKASTLVNQGLSLAQGAIAAGPHNFIKGFISKEANAFVKKSNFLTTVGDTVTRSLRTGNAYTKAVGIAGDTLIGAQQATNKIVWKGFFELGKSKGMTNEAAFKFAEGEAPKLVANRMLGMGPGIYNTTIGKIFGAFTIEPTAASVRLFSQAVKGFKGNPKALAEVIGTVTAWHLLNKANEKYGTGYSPYPDAVEAAIDASDYLKGTDTKEKNSLKAIARVFSEALQYVPIANSVFNTAYSGAETAKLVPPSRDVFGQDNNTWMNVGSLYNPIGNVDRGITGNKLIDVPFNIAAKVVPGVEQAAKMTQAGITQARGYAVSKDGDPMYAAPSSPLEIARSLIFGQSSTQNAKDFFNTDFTPWATDTQKKTLDAIPDKNSKLEYLKNIQGTNTVKNKVQSNIESNVGSVNPSDLSTYYFDGKTYDTATFEDKEKVIKTLYKELNNKDLPDEVKTQLLEASKVPEADIEYFSAASMNDRDQLVYSLNKVESFGQDRNKMILWLAQGKRSIAGKAFINNATGGIIDRLYDEGAISKEEKALINAVKWDPIYNKFYMDRDYIASQSGGGMTSAKKKAYITKINSIYKTTLTKVKTPTLPKTPTMNLKQANAGSTGKTKTRWFSAY